ncbi:MAG: rhamnogalacturonan lyase [Bacteroidaceae bacterium]|nr:rhamnogalacturonan lyase [Bacteroidaceae bacterium]
MKRLAFLLFSSSLIMLNVNAQARYDFSRLQMERLDRGVVAVRTSEDSVMVSWRYLKEDPLGTEFDIYRDGKRIGHRGPGEPTCLMDYYPKTKQARYEVRTTRKGVAQRGKWTLPANAPMGYLDIALQQPVGYTDVNGRSVEYIANDATVADLDGDGQMEIVLKWDPSNSKDNSQSGITNNTILDAYKLNGKQLWRIDLGRNIRSGAHYTQFMVYDFDGDGRAELVCKTGDGTIDGLGRVIGDADANHVRQPDTKVYQANGNPNEQFRGPGWPNNMDRKAARGGFIYKGPEYLTVFDGRTGGAIHTVDYVPERGELQDWGDNYANRSERYLACVAYLDGVHPSVVMCRGYYTRSVLAAWDFDGRELKLRWVFDSNKEGRRYAGQGNHNLRVADVDGDGRDEITYGSMAVDDNGKGLYSTGFGHGDAMHVTSFFPLSDRLQVWDCHENKRDGSEFRDAATGKVIFQLPDNTDVGRCMAADIDPTNPGLEMWSSSSGGIRNIRGEVTDSLAHIPINMAVWWDGDLLREMLDHETISKYVPEEHACRPLLQMEGCQFNNGTKSNPCLQGDILGDWREEVLVRTRDNKHLRVYVTAIPTPYRFHTFLQDPVYRHSITTQNVAYNQPTQVGFYFGYELLGSGRLFRGWQF